MKPYEFRSYLQVEAEAGPLLILFIGIPASGKSTFYHRVLEDLSLDYVSLDALGTQAREKSAFDAALAARRSVAVDNTNVTKALRAKYLAPAKAASRRAARSRSTTGSAILWPGRSGSPASRWAWRRSGTRSRTRCRSSSART